MKRIRGGRRKRRHVRPGAPERSLTANAGLTAVSELCDRVGVIEALDKAVGPIKQRDRGFGRWGGADRDRGGAAGRGGLPDRAGPAARCCGWPAAHAGAGAGCHDRGRPGPADPPGAVAGGRARVGGGDRPGASLMPAERAAALADRPVTTHLDTTDPRQRHAVANEFLSHDYGPERPRRAVRTLGPARRLPGRQGRVLASRRPRLEVSQLPAGEGSLRRVEE